MKTHPIFYACFHGQVDKLEKLLEADPKLVEELNSKSLTPLQVAASRNQAETIKFLVKKGADLYSAEADSWTPLVFASYRGHIEAVETLLKLGADPTSKGGNPIHYAGQRRHKNICRLLVSHGAVDQLVQADDLQKKDFLRAAYSYQPDKLSAILKYRPELLDFQDRLGQTALHATALLGDSKSTRLLLKAGAKHNLLDKKGRSPLDVARRHNQKSVVAVFDKIAIKRA